MVSWYAKKEMKNKRKTREKRQRMESDPRIIGISREENTSVRSDKKIRNTIGRKNSRRIISTSNKTVFDI